MYKIVSISLFFVLMFGACSTLTQSEIQEKQETLNVMSQEAIDGLIEQDPTIKKELENAVGYAVANMKLTKVPIFGAGGGKGVLVDSKTQEHYYFTVSRLDIGGGWGVRSYKVLLVINSQKVLEELKTGLWKFEAGAEVSAGSNAAGGNSGALQEDFTMHVLADGGASATVTARVIHARINKDLTQ
ncbi:MAG: hypothetical protein U9N52_04365 [Campylobacterota bacterium]|nr:hypothetical protein [Campylobacterota bacterium]